MVSTIHFYHQQQFATIKISYIRSQRFLSRELIAKRSMRKHVFSDNFFCHGRFLAILSRIDFMFDTIRNEWEFHGMSRQWAKIPPSSAPFLDRRSIGREFLLWRLLFTYTTRNNKNASPPDKEGRGEVPAPYALKTVTQADCYEKSMKKSLLLPQITPMSFLHIHDTPSTLSDEIPKDDSDNHHR